MGWWQRRKQVAALKSADPVERRQALGDLVREPEPGLAAELLPLLDDPDPGLQEATVAALGQLGEAAATGPLVAVLARAGARESLRLAAATALARLPGAAAGDGLAAALDATLAVQGDLSEVETHRVRVLAGALAARGDRRASPGLLVALVAADSAETARLVEDLTRLAFEPGDDVERALWAIVRLEHEELARVAEEGLPLLLARLEHPDAHIRAHAADLLGRLQDRRGYDSLVAVSADADPAVQDAATLALVRLGWRPTDARGRALSALVRGAWREVGDAGAAAVEPLCARIRGTRTSQLAPFELEEVVRRLDQIGLALAEALRREPEAVEASLLQEIAALAPPAAGTAGGPALDYSRARAEAQKELARRGAR
jgi:HEAT repeat protein